MHRASPRPRPRPCTPKLPESDPTAWISEPLRSGSKRSCMPVAETDLAESENELQNVSPILQNQICGKTTTAPGFGELIDRECSPKPEVVVVLPHIWFWRIGLTFWSSFSHSHRSVSVRPAAQWWTGPSLFPAAPHAWHAGVGATPVLRRPASIRPFLGECQAPFLLP